LIVVRSLAYLGLSSATYMHRLVNVIHNLNESKDAWCQSQK